MTGGFCYLQQKFSRFLSYRLDNQELLLFLLKQLVHEHSAFERSRNAAAAGVEGTTEAEAPLQVEVPEQELLERARQVNIPSVRAFLTSELFTAHRFTYDVGRKLIIHNL